MMFDHIKVGDEVSVWNTDHTRQYGDMLRYTGRAKVIRVTDGMLWTEHGGFMRRNGCMRTRSRWSVRPVDDERDHNSLRIQAEFAEKEKQRKGEVD